MKPYLMVKKTLFVLLTFGLSYKGSTIFYSACNILVLLPFVNKRNELDRVKQKKKSWYL